MKLLGYRVVKRTCGPDNFVWFVIYEVCCNDDDKLSWTVVNKAPTGNTLEELRADLEMMLKATNRPILERIEGKLVEVEQ